MLQVRLDGMHRNGEPLRDLSIRHPLVGEAGDPGLGTRQGIRILATAALTTADGGELFGGTSGDHFRANRVRQLERFGKWLACRNALAPASKVHAVAQKDARLQGR